MHLSAAHARGVGLIAVLVVLAPLPAAADWASEAGGAADHTEVVGGQPADPGEDPWMAALVLDERYEPTTRSGA